MEPCNKCEQCVSITNGTNMDVLELDAASNRGIDEIRALRDTIKLAPFQAQKKVYIIDEVHMLTTEAFNALLKTLEEPPSHAMFILCTTEPHKIPATIISRCVHIPFTHASDEELIRSFARVAKGESLVIDTETLLGIAKLADGGFRDGVKILEELVAFAGGKKITKELLEQKYQISNIKYQISEMIAYLIDRDARGGIQLVEKLIEQGVDMRYFSEQLLQELHALLLVKVGIHQISNIKYQISNIRMEDLQRLFELLSRAHGEIKYAVLPSLPLELAIVEWAVLFRHSGKPEAHPESVVSKGDSGSSTRMTEEKTQKTNDNTTNFWQQFIEKTKSYNHSIAGVLRSCKLKEYSKKGLVIQTPYTFHKQKLEEGKAQDLLEKVYQEVTGKKGSVVVELSNK
ncbi:MAG: DNA polymerase III subunit gamma/tau [Candidatus Levybacteria bacterium]|nr:DNA polymerase III subunit gamma/tau [Candidatus Levybacteria bacterium]